MPVSATPSISDTNSLGLQQFLRILTDQLVHQDPLKPMDNQEFVTQLAQFSALEQSRQMNVKFDQLLLTDGASASVGMLGKTVSYNRANGQLGSGRVSAIGFDSGSALLTITDASGAAEIGVQLAQIVNLIP